MEHRADQPSGIASVAACRILQRRHVGKQADVLEGARLAMPALATSARLRLVGLAARELQKLPLSGVYSPVLTLVNGQDVGAIDLAAADGDAHVRGLQAMKR